MNAVWRALGAGLWAAALVGCVGPQLVTRAERQQGALAVVELDASEFFTHTVGMRARRFNPGGQPEFFDFEAAGSNIYYFEGLPSGAYTLEAVKGVTAFGVCLGVVAFFLPQDATEFPVQSARFFSVKAPGNYYWGKLYVHRDQGRMPAAFDILPGGDKDLALVKLARQSGLKRKLSELTKSEVLP